MILYNKYCFLILILITSCDCVQRVEGTVIDSETLQLIDSALISKFGREISIEHTDSIGNFTLQGISGGLFGCPGMKVEIKKFGYETQVVHIKNAGYEKIKMKKLN